MTKKNSPTNNRIFITILLVLMFGSLYLLSPVLTPFLLGALIAYLCNPLVERLMRLRMSRILAVLLVFFTAFTSIMILILLLIPLVQEQVTTLISQIPDMISSASTKANWVMNYYDISFPDQASLKKFLSDYVGKAGGANWVIQTTLSSGKTIFETIIYIVLVPIVTFYLLRDWDIVLSSIAEILPRKIKPRLIVIAKECDEVLSAFFRGQLLVMLALGLYYSITLSILGLKVGVIIGIIVALISMIPYLGAIVGVILAGITTFMQFGDAKPLIWIAVIFSIGHIIEGFILTPILIGNRVGLHPVVVIFAILAGGTLFGLFGVLLAIPSAAVIVILLRHLLKHYHEVVDNIG